MHIPIDDILFQLQIPATDFLSSQLGVTLQVATLVGLSFAGVKFLNKQLDNKINNQIMSKISPVVSDLCKQISDIQFAIKQYQLERNGSQKTFEEKTNTAIKYIDKALDRMQKIDKEEDR